MGGSGDGCEYSASCSVHRLASVNRVSGKYGNLSVSAWILVLFSGSSTWRYNSLCILRVGVVRCLCVFKKCVYGCGVLRCRDGLFGKRDSLLSSVVVQYGLGLELIWSSHRFNCGPMVIMSA